MTDAELQRLWDPRSPSPGGEAIDALESRLSSLRSPSSLPSLELPSRTSADAPAASVSDSHEESRSWLGPALALAAVVALFVFARAWLAEGTAPPSDTTSVAQARVVRAPAPVPPTRPDALPLVPSAWRVESFDGQSMCQGEGVAEVVREGAELSEAMALDTGPGSTARLRRGDAIIDLHPESRVRQGPEALELSYGRAWVELPAIRSDGESDGESDGRSDGDGDRTWELRTAGVSLQAREARFVWWAYEGTGPFPEAPSLAKDEVGIELVSGELDLHLGDQVVKLEAGQRCRIEMNTAPPTVQCERLGAP